MAYRSYQPLIQPGFLRGVYGTAWGAALGIVKDFFADLTKQGVQQRFIGSAQAEALAMIGAERGIPQGVSESVQSYVESLVLAWSAWELGGTPWSILALMNFLGYADVYVACQNGSIFGPSGSVVLPNPNTDTPGTPPAVTTGGNKWTFAIGSTAYGSQGAQYSPALGGFTWSGYWEPSTAYTTPLVQPNPPNGLYYSGTTGTSGSAAPAWPSVVGGTVTDGGVTWTCVGPVDGAPVGQSQGFCSTDFWSAYILIFSPAPGSWSDVENPPAPTSDPSLYEVDAISSLVSSFNAAHATCCGFFLPGSGSRASFGWPNGRTFYGDAGLSSASADGLTTLWVPNQAVATGDQRIPTSPNGYWYKCTTPGTTGYVQPTWPTPTGTVSDGTAVWTCEGPTEPYTNGVDTPGATVFQFEQTQP